MKRVSTILATMAAFAAAASDKPALEGAEAGVWTQDHEAAVAAAAKDGLPVFLDFTGSDWCGWCKLMEERVFSKDEWKDWAKGKIYLVTLDFPSDETIVPEKWKERNRELQRKYKVRGYPTYVVLDKDGRELGRLGASRNATPEQFIEDLEKTLASDPVPEAAPADPEVRKAVDAILAAARAAEEEAKKIDDPTVADLAGTAKTFAAKLKAVDLSKTPADFSLAATRLAKAFGGLAVPLAKLDPKSKLNGIDDADPDMKAVAEALEAVGEAIEGFMDAAAKHGVDRDEIADAF